jgi:hypothetical protein
MLREITVSDGPEYLSIFGNANHMRLFGVDPILDFAGAENFIKLSLVSLRVLDRLRFLNEGLGFVYAPDVDGFVSEFRETAPSIVR